MLTDNLYTFGRQDEGTLVTLTDDISLQGIARVLLPVMPGLVRSAYRKNLTGLKAILEGSPLGGLAGSRRHKLRTVEAPEHTRDSSLGTTTTSVPGPQSDWRLSTALSSGPEAHAFDGGDLLVAGRMRAAAVT